MFGICIAITPICTALPTALAASKSHQVPVGVAPGARDPFELQKPCATGSAPLNDDLSAGSQHGT